jgi:CubicO group peptidase (beta-lactamase class C family)
VRQVLDHESGVCTVDERLTVTKMSDPDFMAGVIARQAPAWEPGTRRGYHYLTVGWIEAELIRRVDPLRRTFGRFFQDEVAAPLGLEFYFGLPSDVPASRVATIKAFHGLRMLLHTRTLPRGMVTAFFRPGSLTSRTLGNPRLSSPGVLDSPEFRALGLPAAGGIGRVRDIAKAFGVLATGGAELGITGEVIADMAAPAHVPSGGPVDLVWHTDLAFRLGFIKPSTTFRFGTSGGAFGCEGAGGSFAFADPDLGLGYAYAPNRLGFHLLDDPREKALRDALYRCLARTSSRGAPGR